MAKQQQGKGNGKGNNSNTQTPKPKLKQVTIRLHPKLWIGAKKAAIEQGVTLGDLIATAVNDAVATWESVKGGVK